MRSAVKQEPAASPHCRSRRFLSAPGPACTKLWKTARSMPSDCARSLWTSRHCTRQVRSFFWGWTPATCTARRPRPPRIGHWFPLPTQAGQGTVVLDTARVASTELATVVAARQLRAVVALLVARGLHPIIVGDRWYACAPFLTRLADVEAASLLRVKSNRVFYRRAPERFPGQVGAKSLDGERFQCKDEGSHGEADETWEGVDAK